VQLTALVTVLLTLAPYLVPPLIALLALLVSRATANLPTTTRPLVVAAVADAVHATEQVASDALNSAGKKQTAVDMVEAQLDHLGIKVPSGVVSTLIESAVNQMNADLKPAPTPPVMGMKIGEAQTPPGMRIGKAA
jgi:hypothetical protein